MPPKSDLEWSDLRPGMIFVDATKPSRRVTILKILPERRIAWVATIGGTRGVYPITSIANFHWTSLTGTDQLRRTGYYLDPTIQGNTPEHWAKVPAPLSRNPPPIYDHRRPLKPRTRRD